MTGFLACSIRATSKLCERLDVASERDGDNVKDCSHSLEATETKKRPIAGNAAQYQGGFAWSRQDTMCRVGPFAASFA